MFIFHPSVIKCNKKVYFITIIINVIIDGLRKNTSNKTKQNKQQQRKHTPNVGVGRLI